MFKTRDVNPEPFGIDFTRYVVKPGPKTQPSRFTTSCAETAAHTVGADDLQSDRKQTVYAADLILTNGCS